MRTYQAPVFELLDLELCQGVGVIGQAQGVEGATRVQLVQAYHAGSLARDSESLSLPHQDHLPRPNNVIEKTQRI
jgi:hypothetical protein